MKNFLHTRFSPLYAIFSFQIEILRVPMANKALNFLNRIRQNAPFNSPCQWACDVERVQCQYLKVCTQSICKKIETAGKTRSVPEPFEIINTVRTGIIENRARTLELPRLEKVCWIRFSVSFICLNQGPKENPPRHVFLPLM